MITSATEVPLAGCHGGVKAKVAEGPCCWPFLGSVLAFIVRRCIMSAQPHVIFCAFVTRKTGALSPEEQA